MRSILSDLAEEAEGLYKPHKGAKSVEVRAAIGRADQAEAQLRQQMATATDVAAIEDRIRRAEAARSNATAAHAAATHAARLARQRASAFLHAVELAQLRSKLADLHAQAVVPDQAQLDALTSATSTFERTHRDLAELETTLDERQSERDAIEIDGAVLADAAAITTLGQQLEARTQDRNRLALLNDQVEAHRRSALTALDDLTGPDLRPIPDRLRDVHVPADRAAALDELGSELTRAESLDERLRETHLQALRRVREVAGAFEPIDLDTANRAVELRRTITMPDSPVALHRAAAKARVTASDDLQRALETVRDLAGPAARTIVPQTVEWPGVGPTHVQLAEASGFGEGPVSDEISDRAAAESGHLTDASIAQAPPARRMTELRDRLRTATTAAESAALDHTKAVGRRQQAQHALDTVRADAPLPSPGVLRQVRAHRDEWLNTMLSALRNGDAETVMAATVGLVRGSMSADRIADELIAGADRLAGLARREAEVRAAARGVTDAAHLLESARREHRFIHTQWAALWTVGGAPVPHPDVADIVQRALHDAHRAHADLLQADLRRDELATEVAHLGEQLRAVLAAAGHPRPCADLPSLLGAVDEVEDLLTQTREHRARLAELRNQAHAAGEAADGARQDRDEAAARWRFGLAAAGLPTDLNPAQWATRCETITVIRQSNAEAEFLEQEAAELQTVLAAFDTMLAEQVARHRVRASDTAGAVSELSTRLATAETARIAAGHHDREIAALTDAIDNATIAATAAAETHDRIAVELDIDSGEIPTALTAGQRRIDLNAAITRVTILVHTAAPDLDLEEFLTTIEHHSHNELDEMRDIAQARQQSDRAQLDAIAEELGGLRRDLDQRQNAQPAAVLHAIATEHTAQAAEAAQRYLVVQLQREILSRELLAYERQHSSQLLTAAGELLERLTGGRYVAVRPRTDNNQRSLVVVRADDEEQSLDELSEGTADQLYLALRLAGIDQLQSERINRGLPTVPVVLDDILITFDETRAAAAVTALAELSARWQIILLTHHDHLAELARRIDINPPTITALAPPPNLKITRDPQSIRTATPPAVSLRRIPAPRGHTEDPGRVRTWARENGLDVGERGRIPAEILDAFRRAGSAAPEIA